MALLFAQEVATDQPIQAAPFWMNPLFLVAVLLVFSLAAIGLVVWLVRMQSRKQRSVD